jgi:hypothetical protein
MVSYQTKKDFTGCVLKIGEGAAGKVAQTGKALIINDYRNWEGRASYFEEEKPFVSVISAPMTWQDQILGVIEVCIMKCSAASQKNSDAAYCLRTGLLWLSEYSVAAICAAALLGVIINEITISLKWKTRKKY